jgi:putative colanic acid biosynthesis UDP-glucose lipid carrier transferase
MRRALLVGTSQQAAQFAHRLARNPWIGIAVVGYVNGSTPNHEPDTEIAPGIDPECLGRMKDVARLVREHRVDLVYLTLPLARSHEIEGIVREVMPLHVDIHWVPDISAFELINHGMREIEGQPILCLSDSPIDGMGRMGKWLEDKLLASAILFLSSPALILIAIAVKLSSPGPIFFKQKRAGLNGKVFEVWKFRTMYIHREAPGRLSQAQPRDARVTPLGAFLRRTSLDEFPQFFNVLRGNMSIVGPRPHALEHDGFYERQIDAYMLRHRIKPGITGWAQVNGWRGQTDALEKMEMRIKYDLYYINNWSLAFDFRIIAMTAWTVIAGRNAY